MVLCSLHRLTPLAQRFLCIEIPQNNFFVVLIQGMQFHCPILFSRSTDFSSPLRNIANFGVRVYVSIDGQWVIDH